MAMAITHTIAARMRQAKKNPFRSDVSDFVTNRVLLRRPIGNSPSRYVAFQLTLDSIFADEIAKVSQNYSLFGGVELYTVHLNYSDQTSSTNRSASAYSVLNIDRKSAQRYVRSLRKTARKKRVRSPTLLRTHLGRPLALFWKEVDRNS